MDNDSKVEIGDHKQSHKRDLTVHGIPYSEHSSFPELVECIDCLKRQSESSPRSLYRRVSNKSPFS